MKKIIVFLISLLFLVGCETTIEQKNGNGKVNGSNVTEFVYDGCEYVYFPFGYGTVSHKGNCKNPIHQYNKPNMKFYDYHDYIGSMMIDSVVVDWRKNKIGIWLGGELVECDSITKLFSTVNMTKK